MQAPLGSFLFDWQALPALTQELPGTGGTIRKEADDFQVTEIPLYLPSGKGSHIYLRLRKRNLTTRDLVLALVSAGLEEKEIGVAGLKDKHALSEQWLSIPNRHVDKVELLEQLDGVELLERSRHKNKLGLGHLKGNHFRVTLRSPAPDALAKAQRILKVLDAKGLPNYFGPQRFGRFGANALDGLKLIRGEWVPGGHRLKRFFISALQSHLFNHMLKARLEQGLFDEVVTGDWAKKHDTGGVFEVENAALERERAKRFEISATLPLYGKKVRPSKARAGAIESDVLERFGLNWADFRSRRGDRRWSRIRLEDILLETHDNVLVVAFSLPKGSFATSVLRELTKEDVDAPLKRDDKPLSDY